MLDILHTPYGHEHPYEQLPEERFPRQPLAGQVFMVGIVIRPSGAAAEVFVHIENAGVPPVVIRAVQQLDWQQKQEDGVGAEFLERMVRIDQDVWHAQMSAPPYGQTLTYWIEAEGVITPRYTVRGETWITDETAVTNLQIHPHDSTAGTAFPIPTQVEWLSDGTRKRRVRLTVPCAPDEQFFGLGERFNALNQRGNRIDVRVYEQYKNQGQRTYLPIPFLLSSAGYGVWVESSRWMQFDLAASAEDCWRLEADVGADEALSLHTFAGDPLDIIAQFTQITGPAALPPEWVFGLWMSSNEWNSQARVEQEVRTSLEHGIQPAVVVIEAWSDETTFYIWNDAEYAAKEGAEAFHYSDFTFPPDGKWTNPKGMVDWLHSLGIKVLLWQIPALKVITQPHAQHQADHDHFVESGFGVRDADQRLHKIRPFWFRDGYLWDVTRPAEREWWLNKRAYLLDDVGIDGFKTDGGEHLWGTDTRFADGRRGDEVWNEYPQKYAAAYYDFAHSKRGGITFSRAGTTGSQRAPLHWAGDENSTWDAFRHSIYAGFNAAISGIPFWGWDFGGFSGEPPTAELYLRALAMATFCPVLQYHSEYNPPGKPSRDRTPWNIAKLSGDARVVPIFKAFMGVRERILPYLWREAQHTAATGEPLMRPLQVWYPHQAGAFQYLFGRDLLACPVTEPDTVALTCFLPAGEWRDFWTGESFTGGGEVVVPAPLDRIPVFMRAGAAL